MAAKKKRTISPPYPYIGLKKCVDLVGKLEKTAGRSEVTKENAINYMGLDPDNLNTSRAFSALTTFGLIVEMRLGKTKMVSVSEIARRILLTRVENSPIKISALQTAASNYDIIRELRMRWPEKIPSEDNHIFDILIHEHKFSTRAAKSFIPAFKETYAFAKLGSQGIVSQEEEQRPGTPDSYEEPQDVHKPKDGAYMDMKEFPILLLGDTAFVKIRLPLSEKNHKLIVEWLENNKEALTYTGNQGQRVVEDEKETE